MEPIWKSIVSTLNEFVEVNAFEVNGGGCYFGNVLFLVIFFSFSVLHCPFFLCATPVVPTTKRPQLSMFNLVPKLISHGLLRWVSTKTSLPTFSPLVQLPPLLTHFHGPKICQASQSWWKQLRKQRFKKNNKIKEIEMKKKITWQYRFFLIYLFIITF